MKAIVFTGLILALTQTTVYANPCAPVNPCAAQKGVNPRLVTRPEGTQLMVAEDLLDVGKALWSDSKLSSNSMSCNTCHANNASFKPSFAEAYPHAVKMADDQAGVKSVHLDEMVQFCLLVPMATQPLPWDSKELAALTAYTAAQQQKFQATGK